MHRTLSQGAVFFIFAINAIGPVGASTLELFLTLGPTKVQRMRFPLFVRLAFVLSRFPAHTT